MPEMTKATTGEPASNAGDKTEQPKTRCAQVKDCDRRHVIWRSHFGAAETGSKKWWWEARVSNAFVFGVSGVPILASAASMWKPGVSGTLTDKSAAALNLPAGVHGTVVETRLTDPSLWERFLVGFPLLSVGFALMILAYAMYRMDINMTGHTRPYTKADHKWLHRAYNAVLWGWIIAVFGHDFIPGWLPAADGLSDPRLVPAMDETWLLLPLLVSVAGVLRLHRQAKGQHEKLEKIV